MVKRVRAGVTAVPIVLAFAGAAQAKNDCNLSITNLGTPRYQGSLGGDYDPFAGGTGPTTVQMLITKTGKECPYFITFSQGASGSYDRRAYGGGAQLRYNIYGSPSTSAQPLQDFPVATSQTVLAGQFFGRGNETATVTYYLDVPQGQLVTPGSYTDTLTISIYEGTISSPELDLSYTSSMVVYVAAVIDVEIAVDGVRAPLDGRRLTLDLGELSPGMTSGFELYTRGNTPYRVELESENLGVLRITDGPEEVPYSIRLDGVPVDLSVPGLVGYAAPGSGTVRNQADLVIESFGARPAGIYSDALTVTVSAN